MATKPRPVDERLFEKVDKQGPGGCWLWMGATNEGGYGNISTGGRAQRRAVLVHRLSFELHVGPIPTGLHLDHLCRRRNCVNPAHLEPVTCRENLARGEHPSMVTRRTGKCRQGHDYVPIARGANPPSGCRACAAAFQRNRRARLKAERLQATG